MYEVNYSSEKQLLTNGDSKLTKNQFTKSLTSFHTKKSISKNISTQNPPKKSSLIKQDKSVKNKRVYLSSKKAKALNYLKLNPLSPQNELITELNKPESNPLQKNKIFNAPSSVQRSYKYENCYILNNLNNYQPHVIPGSISKTKNTEDKYIDKKLSESIEKYNDNENIIELNNNINNNNSYTTSENRKTNGASSNINEINENNSLIQPSINGLNTITFNINNNYNNCYNNYEMNNYNKKSAFIQFNGYMNINGYEGLNNKSVCNSNDYSKEKNINKLEESLKDNLKNININIESNNKVINNKRSNLFKGKSKNKTKSKQTAYSNTANTNSVTNFNLNNFKKSQKSFNLNEKTENNYNKNYIYETMDNIMHNDDNNFPRSKNIYKFNKFNNKKINLNKRNLNYKENEIENTKSLNSLESSQKNQMEKNNDKKLKDSNSNKENENPYQTYSGSFRNNNKMIKVNMIDTKKSAMDKINNEFTNEENINSQKTAFKNNNKSTNNLKTLVDKYENKNSFGFKKFNKKNNSQSNKKINIINNNKAKFTEKNNKNTKNILIQTYNNFKKGKDEEENIINIKEDINQTNYNEPNLNSNELQTKSVNCLNCYTKKNNIIPLTRENSITYVRKKSLNMKIYNNVTKNNFLSSRPSAFKHKKNYSISSSCYNTQRNFNEQKIDTKNKSNKKSIIYSPKNGINKINLDEKTIAMPEYKIKLENIKSRINNLLNIYSLLALRALNVPSGEHTGDRDKIDNIENVDKNEEY